MTDIQRAKNFRPLRSLTRLLVGGILLGLELLENQLQTWDSSPEAVDSPQNQKDTEELPAFEPLPESIPAPQVGKSIPSSRSPAVRYALIGLVFEGEDKLEEALDAVLQISSFSDRVLNPINKSIQRLGVTPLVRNRFDQLSKRGQSALDRIYCGPVALHQVFE